MFSLCLSYAEVRAEQRRELGIEESPPEISADKVRHYRIQFCFPIHPPLQTGKYVKHTFIYTE